MKKPNQRNIFIIMLTLLLVIAMFSGCAEGKVGFSDAAASRPSKMTESPLLTAATLDSPSSSPIVTPEPTPTPVPTTKPDYILFENDEIRIAFLGVWPVEQGVSSDTIKLQIENLSDDYYSISVTPETDSSGAIWHESGDITVGTKQYRSMFYELTNLIANRSSITLRICALDSRNSVIMIPTDGSIDTVSFTLYFSKSAGSFDTGLMTIDLTNPNATRPAIFDLNTTDFSGNPVTFQTIESNRLTMVNFWATWCGYCVEEMPDLSRLAVEYADQGFGTIGVLIWDDESIDAAKSFVETSGITYPNVVCEEVFTQLAKNQFAIPVTMFFDSQGSMVGEILVGAKSYEEWKDTIEKYLVLQP